MDKEARFGRSRQRSVYDRRRSMSCTMSNNPHGAIGNKVPIALMESVGAASPSPLDQ